MKRNNRSEKKKIERKAKVDGNKWQRNIKWKTIANKQPLVIFYSIKIYERARAHAVTMRTGEIIEARKKWKKMEEKKKTEKKTRRIVVSETQMIARFYAFEWRWSVCVCCSLCSLRLLLMRRRQYQQRKFAVPCKNTCIIIVFQTIFTLLFSPPPPLPLTSFHLLLLFLFLLITITEWIECCMKRNAIVQ